MPPVHAFGSARRVSPTFTSRWPCPSYRQVHRFCWFFIPAEWEARCCIYGIWMHHMHTRLQSPYVHPKRAASDGKSVFPLSRVYLEGRMCAKGLPTATTLAPVCRPKSFLVFYGGQVFKKKKLWRSGSSKLTTKKYHWGKFGRRGVRFVWDGGVWVRPPFAPSGDGMVALTANATNFLADWTFESYTYKAVVNNVAGSTVFEQR